MTPLTLFLLGASFACWSVACYLRGRSAGMRWVTKQLRSRNLVLMEDVTDELRERRERR